MGHHHVAWLWRNLSVRARTLFRLRRLWSCKANTASGLLWRFCAWPPPCFCRALEGSQHPNPMWVLIHVSGASQSKPSSAGRDMEQVQGAECPPVGPIPWLQWPNPLWAMVSPKPSCPTAFSSPADGTMGSARVVGRVAFPSMALLQVWR